MWWLALLIVIGCGKHDPEQNGPVAGTNPGAAQPSDPSHAVYDQMRSGFVQLGTVTQTLADALDSAKAGKELKDAKIKETSSSIAELMDSAGSYIADYTEPPDSFEAFNAKFAANDDARLKAIDAANDCLHEVVEAKDALTDLLNDPKLEKNPTVQDLQGLLDDADKGLREAIQTLGGKVDTGGD